MTRRDFTLSDLHLAIDGELSVEERGEFERWLESHPDMKALKLRYESDRATLAAALAPLLDEPVPPRLLKTISGDGRPRRSWGAVLRSMAAAVVLLAIGGGTGYWAGLSGAEVESTENSIVSDAIVAHIMYAAEKLHVVEVGADQQDHLIGWLSKRVGTPLVAADFSTEGFSLIGGRLLPLAERPAAQLMYQDEAGNRISLYVIVDKGADDTGFRRYVERGTTALYWIDKGYCYAVTGAVPEDKLRAIAEAAFKQMLEV